MPRDFKQQFEQALDDLRLVVSTSSMVDLKKNLEQAIVDVKQKHEQYVNAALNANDKADQVIDPLLDRARQSRYTPLLLAFIGLLCGAVGFAVAFVMCQ